MQYFLLIYFNSKPLHVSSRLAAHHQEDELCINSNWYSHVFMLTVLLAAAAASQHKHMTIPIAIYTEFILLMMSSKPARNM